MLIPLLVAVLGLLWLLKRLSGLLSVRLEKAVRFLNVSVPRVPVISVDKVTDHSITVHWDRDDVARKSSTSSVSSPEGPPLVSNSSPASISHFVLYVNGLQAALVDGFKQSCVIEGLRCDTNYQVDLVAFNLANFRSRSSPIFVKTAANSSEPVFSTHPDALLRALVPGGLARGKLNVHEGLHEMFHEQRSRSGTIGDVTAAKPPNLITDINELKFLLESGLDEVRSLMAAYQEAEKEFGDEEVRLMQTRMEAKKRRRLEDANRTSLRQEIKYLEEQRLKGQSKLAGDQRTAETRLKRIKSKKTQIAQWHAKMEEMQRERRSLAGPAAMPSADELLQQQISELNKDIFSLQDELHGLDTEMKSAIGQRKQAEAEKRRYADLFGVLEKETDVSTGLLSSDGQAELDSVVSLKPQWKNVLVKEVVDIDRDSEQEWRKLQQSEFRRFEALKRKVDGAPNISPHVANISPNVSLSGSFYSVSQPPPLNQYLPQNLIDNHETSALEISTSQRGSVDANAANGSSSNRDLKVTSLSALANSAANLAAAAALAANHNQTQTQTQDERSARNSVSGAPLIQFPNASSQLNLVQSSPIQQSHPLMNGVTATTTESLLGSPQSVRATTLQPTDSILSNSLLDLGIPMTLAGTGATGADLDHAGRAIFDFSNNSNMSLAQSSPTGRTRGLSQFSKLLNPFSQNSGTPTGPPALDFGRNSLDVISRKRSTSFGSSIWSSNTGHAPGVPGQGWNSSLLGQPLSLVGSAGNTSPSAVAAVAAAATAELNGAPKQHHRGFSRPRLFGKADDSSKSEVDVELQSAAISAGSVGENQHHQSPSFFKKGIFKFGASPTKTPSKSSDKSSIALTINTEESKEKEKEREKEKEKEKEPVSASRSSRFFKLGSRKTSQHGAASGGSTNSTSQEETDGSGAEGAAGVFSRKLTFGFKRHKIDEEDEDDEDEEKDEKDEKDEKREKQERKEKEKQEKLEKKEKKEKERQEKKEKEKQDKKDKKKKEEKVQ